MCRRARLATKSPSHEAAQKEALVNLRDLATLWQDVSKHAIALLSKTGEVTDLILFVEAVIWIRLARDKWMSPAKQNCTSGVLNSWGNGSDDDYCL